MACVVLFLKKMKDEGWKQKTTKVWRGECYTQFSRISYFHFSFHHNSSVIQYIHFREVYVMWKDVRYLLTPSVDIFIPLQIHLMLLIFCTFSFCLLKSVCILSSSWIPIEYCHHQSLILALVHHRYLTNQPTIHPSIHPSMLHALWLRMQEVRRGREG